MEAPNMTGVTEMLVYDAYEHRAIIKRHGGRWEAEKKWWRVPVRFEDEALELFTHLKARSCKVALKRKRGAA